MTLLLLLLAQHEWLDWRHLMQVLRTWNDSSRIQRAFTEADRVVPAGDTGKRGRRVEQEAIRRLAQLRDLLPNVAIAEVDGRRLVQSIGEQHAPVGGTIVGEADVLKLKRGRSIAAGAEFDVSAVDSAWDYKLPDRPMKSSQRARYRDVFGVEPIEIHPTPVGRAVTRRAASEAAGAGQFAAAYVLKEAMNGRNALPDLAQPRFWGSVAAFSVASRFVRGSVLPLVVGMAAVNVLYGLPSVARGDSVSDHSAKEGGSTPQELGRSVLSYLVAGTAVSFVADGLVYPMLFAAGPPGWLAAGAYSIAKMTLTLYLAEKLLGAFAPAPAGPSAPQRLLEIGDRPGGFTSRAARHAAVEPGVRLGGIGIDGVREVIDRTAGVATRAP
jgi:hypothetical protein